MSGLAAVLAGREPPGIHRWHAAFEVEEVRHAVEHAGWGFGYVDGWTGADTKPAFLAAVGEALDFPDHYGQNFDALADCLHDIGEHRDGVVLLWDGWATLARTDERAFSVALSVLGSRVEADRGVPFVVLLRGEGPVLPGVTSLD
ncbi:barstar family protein [Nocardioides sp. zg-1228]|uniref:barstar family protein n=1 Tax=Nocardioides sp. zg-1228 TaxID=2763008 RepID=UPI001642FE9A|nr:barstar family protein [Nocardioides sp. zg-1228]MBC2933511.1 barstar family protein [Nocardioides sp. zg-1228]QSF56355.1 barstar family protein [Nocardioides sp. zg-1228]